MQNITKAKSFFEKGFGTFYAVCFTDIDELNLLLRLSDFFATAQIVSKNNACYKSGQNWHKNSHLAALILIGETDSQ